MKVIGIDLGGTKVAAAVVNEKGKILREETHPTDLSGGWPRLRSQLLSICRDLRKAEAGVRAVGIGSAGPLHAPSGKLLDPTNFGWVSPLKVDIAGQLRSSLRLPVRLENDAAAAILAEHWRGRSGPNSVVLTLGTGLGVGVIANGRLVRGGRELHPEGGHLLLNPGDPTALCGCGNFGCAEAYLSGKNFAQRAARLWGEPERSAKEIAEMATSGNPRAIAAFAEYSERMAQFLHNMVVLYYPERVVLTGSFAQAHPLFLPLVEEHLRTLIARRLKTLPLFPKITPSRLGQNAGVLGAAYIALHKNYAD